MVSAALIPNTPLAVLMAPVSMELTHAAPPAALVGLVRDAALLAVPPAEPLAALTTIAMPDMIVVTMAVHLLRRSAVNIPDIVRQALNACL